MVQCRVRIRDFSDTPSTGLVPINPQLGIARAQIDLTTSTLVTDREQMVPITGGDRTLTLDDNTVYRVRLPNTDGFRQKQWVRTTTTDLPLATLLAEHLVDPATLLPLPAVPPSTQELLEQAEQILTDVQAAAFTFRVDPDDPTVLLVGYPVYALDPADPTVLRLPIGA